MQKILFSRSNVQSLGQEAGQISYLLNQLQSVKITKLSLLNALVSVFGYKNWSQFCAVNKEDREYFPFSLCVSCHVRTVADELEVQLGVDKQLLMLAVSAAELGISDLSEAYLVDCVKRTANSLFRKNHDYKIDHKLNTVWFTKDLKAPSRHLALHPLAAEFERHGVRLDTLTSFFPEFGYWCYSFFGLEPDCVVVFNEPVWFRYEHLFDLQSRPLDKIEVTLKEKGDKCRRCYTPVYLDDGEDVLEKLLEAIVEGLPYCDVDFSDCENIADREFIKRVWERCENLEKVKEISVAVYHPSRMQFYEEIIPMKRIKVLGSDVEVLFLAANSNDFTLSLSDWEPRLRYQEGRREVLKEPWLNFDDINKFIAFREKALDELRLKVNPIRYMQIEPYVNSYWAEVMEDVI